MENSIKDYVPAMMYQSYEIADNLAKAGKELESQLNEYEDFFEGLLNDRAADAVILRKETAGNYVAYVASFSRKKVGDNPVAVQFLADGLVVADGTIVKQGETFVVTQIIPEVEDVDNPPEIYEPVLGNKIKIVTE